MQTSVIIPSLNAPTLARALAAVMAQTEPPGEVIVVGRDEAGALAAFPAVRFLDTGAPVCAARARNLGLAAATGELLLLLDADCIPRPDWLAATAPATPPGSGSSAARWLWPGPITGRRATTSPCSTSSYRSCRPGPASCCRR